MMGLLVLSFSFDNCKYFSIYNLQDCFPKLLLSNPTSLASSMSNIFGICKVLVLFWKFWDIVWHTHVCYGIKLLKLNVDMSLHIVLISFQARILLLPFHIGCWERLSCVQRREVFHRHTNCSKCSTYKYVVKHKSAKQAIHDVCCRKVRGSS